MRLDLVGLTDGDEYSLPLTQADLADCLGRSVVHVNRTLMLMRGNGTIEFAASKLRILDLPKRQELGQFDPAYLYLGERPMLAWRTEAAATE